MWHIPINAYGRSLLYAAETFEHFEGLLRLFERLDYEEYDAWWDKLARGLDLLDNNEDYPFGSGEYDDDSSFERSMTMTPKQQSTSY